MQQKISESPEQSEDGALIPQDPHSRSVLWRAASILDAFDGSRRSLTLNELSEKTQLPKSTTHRFAESLVELGWLERSSEGYRIGMRLFEVGGLAERRNQLFNKASSHMHELSAATHLSVQLGILDEVDVVYLGRILVRTFELPTRDGGRMPAYCTALGKAMLAFADEELLEHVVSVGLAPRTPSTIVTPNAFLREIKAIRSCGFAVDRQESVRGIACVAAPIRGAGRAIAAVSVTGPVERIDINRLVPLVRGTAGAIWAERFSSQALDSGYESDSYVRSSGQMALDG